ncbi:MAG: hypothetical protein AABW87_03295 [Nanoarchaeota archaeon]
MYEKTNGNLVARLGIAAGLANLALAAPTVIGVVAKLDGLKDVNAEPESKTLLNALRVAGYVTIGLLAVSSIYCSWQGYNSTRRDEYET